MSLFLVLAESVSTETSEPDLPVTIRADPDTCFWGYFDPRQAPIIRVDSGASIEIETVTHHAGDAPDLLMDEGVGAIWEEIEPETRAPGVHIMTGPIAVNGASPGDCLVVEIEDMWPRLQFGSNCAAHWGRLYDSFDKERITIYGLERLRDGEPAAMREAIARPLFGFDFEARELYDLPGVISEPEPAKREPFSRPVAIPVRPHFGVMGVAPPGHERRSSVPPGKFGGNIDNWRFGPGATIRYPVFHEGAGFYVGDPHFAQGDGELCGTAVEASLNARVRLRIEQGAAPDAPVLETAEETITHGFGETLDQAMVEASSAMLGLLVDRYFLNRDEAYSIISVGVDLGITQVVDGVVGCHAILRRSIFD